MMGWRWLPVFATLVLTFLLIVQVFFFRLTRAALLKRRNFNAARIAVYAVFLVFNVPLVGSVLFHRGFYPVPDWFLYGAVYPLYIWHFASVLLFLLLALIQILMFPVRLIRWLRRREDHSQALPARQDEFSPQRRKLVRSGLVVLAGSAVGGSALGAIRRDNFEVSNVLVPIKDLPSEFQGFSIALISDIHSSIFMEEEKMLRYAASVNDLGADLIAVPGDFVNSMIEEVYPFAEAFSTLRAPSGIYGVLGNHDYFTRQVERVAQEVDQCGIKMLRNEFVTIRRRESSIRLAGIDDTGNQELAGGRVKNIMDRIGTNGPTVLLCHRPYFFKRFARMQVDLTLAGHTHGGQIVFGQIDHNVLAPARMVSPYVAGLYTIGSSNLYVSRGIGTVGIPLRINCPPEITKLTLVSA
jgi:predicted MPP superfamily phosphohydrolase/uncharacterized membrane protein